jgi:DNA-binding MarR family transcriptional regulator
MNSSKNYTDVINRIAKVINIFIAIDRRPYKFGITEPLYPSEIHTIDAIGENEGLNFTDLSDKMGVSRAAISQIIKKMEKKDLVKRYKVDGNDKETLLRLTKKSRTAFDEHKKYHAKRDKEIIDMLKKMTQEEFVFFKTVIGEIEVYAKTVLKDRE